MADAETRAYYEAEAAQRLRSQPKSGLRRRLHDEFHELLRAEARSTVVDFGAGPGVEGKDFTSAGFDYVGIDLALGNGRIAAEQGLHVVAADVVAPPFRRQAFDAGWSMSVLMHLPAPAAARAAEALIESLVPGAPAWVGVWGGSSGVMHWDETIAGERRPFYHRTMQENAELVGRSARIEDIELHEVGGGQYQVLRLRAPE